MALWRSAILHRASTAIATPRPGWNVCRRDKLWFADGFSQSPRCVPLEHVVPGHTVSGRVCPQGVRSLGADRFGLTRIPRTLLDYFSKRCSVVT